METVFRTLSKAQHNVMDALCTSSTTTICEAHTIKPATLGSLCIKGLVDVKSGIVYSTCTMLWNMTFHKEMFDMISKECMDKIGSFMWTGHRVSAIKVLREYTNWGIHEAKLWVNFNYPK